MSNLSLLKQFAIYSVLGALIVVCVLSMPFFGAFSNELSYKHISSLDYRLKISRPSRNSDYILSQYHSDYETYVLNYSDLTAAYHSKSRVESMAAWGATHYSDYGLAERRFVPVFYSKYRMLKV